MGRIHGVKESSVIGSFLVMALMLVFYWVVIATPRYQKIQNEVTKVTFNLTIQENEIQTLTFSYQPWQESNYFENQLNLTRIFYLAILPPLIIGMIWAESLRRKSKKELDSYETRMMRWSTDSSSSRPQIRHVYDYGFWLLAGLVLCLTYLLVWCFIAGAIPLYGDHFVPTEANPGVWYSSPQFQEEGCPWSDRTTSNPKYHLGETSVSRCSIENMLLLHETPDGSIETADGLRWTRYCIALEPLRQQIPFEKYHSFQSMILLVPWIIFGALIFIGWLLTPTLFQHYKTLIDNKYQASVDGFPFSMDSYQIGYRVPQVQTTLSLNPLSHPTATNRKYSIPEYSSGSEPPINADLV